MNESKSPLPQRPLSRRARFTVLAGAAALAFGSVMFAAHYSRAQPSPPAPPEGMTFSGSAVTLAPTAPAWSSLELGQPTAAGAAWSDPIPARVAFDEAATSRVGSPLAGRISRVLVESGQRVTAGMPLFTLTSSGLAELHADAAKSALEYKAAVIDLDRTTSLVDAGSLPGKELLAAKQRVAQAQLAQQLAAQKLTSLKATTHGDAELTVVAPRGGVVVEKHLSVGQQVAPSGGDLVAIADVSSVWVVADLFETDAASVVQGADAQVSLDHGASERAATVTQVSSIVDPDRHTVPVRIQLPNPDGTLRPNAHAQVRLRGTAASVLVPSAAVISDGAKNYVYVADATGALARHDVTIGSVSNGMIPIVAGLALTDRIVVKGGILLDNAIALHDE